MRVASSNTLAGARLTRGMDPSVSVACGETPAAACERLPCETPRSAHMLCDYVSLARLKIDSNR